MTIRKIDYQRCVSCSYPSDIGLNTFFIDLDTSIIKKEEKSPCQVGCPAGVNIPGFVYLLKQRRRDEAVQLLREASPLPAVTGHVCFHPCESECARYEVDEAVNINSLERFLADYWLGERAQPIPARHSDKVAIVGSGPAGLSAAYYLVKQGYPVTVFESMPEPGGMLRYGIPEYRLPRNVLEAQVNYIRDMGVEFRTNTTIGKDLTINNLKDKGYKAVILSIGAQSSRKLEIEGIELKGVLWGLDFLRDINSRRKVKIMDNVLVIGGGDVAVDVALTSLRLGAKKVELACLESEKEMPAHKNYLQLAIDEGVSISPSRGPRRILGKKGKVSVVELISCTSIFDKDGRFNPCFDESETRTVEADTVIFAIGQAPDLALLPEEIGKAAGMTIAVEPLTMSTGLAGVFACGDGVTGPTSVVEAIAAGKEAAISVDRYLKGEDLRAGRKKDIKKVEKPPKEGVEKVTRQIAPLLPVEQRRGNFKEVNTGFTQEIADKETGRCMLCGVRGNCTEVCPMDVLRMDEFLQKPIIRYPEDCMTCYNCELTCPMDAIDVSPIRIELPPIIEYPSGVKENA